jgi:hypothetical protein
VGDFGEGEAGAIVIEESSRTSDKYGSWKRGRSSPKVGDFFTGRHFSAAVKEY